MFRPAPSVRGRSGWVWLGGLPLLAVLHAAGAGAFWGRGNEPAAEPSFPRGVVIESVTCAANPEQSYALYLPGAYTPERNWPVVYAFDPVARGSVPVSLLKEAAERYGYIVVGSNNSRNGPMQPQMEAAGAVWLDTHLRFSLDDKRVYVSGFSGGARLATFLAVECDCVAGVIAHGAGFPANLISAPPKVGFAYFVAIGYLDFNYPEITRLGQQLDELGVTNRVRRFQGGHRWAPAEVWAEALEWMELVAMRDGTRPQDEDFLARQLREASDRAAALEEAGDLPAAYYEYRKLAQEFEGLADVSRFARKTALLKNTEAVRRARKREQEEISRQERLSEEILVHLAALQTQPAERLATMARLRNHIASLKDAIESRGEDAVVERRTLHKIFALAYETGEQSMREEEFPLAAAYFEVASEIAAQAPMPFFQLARARARAGNRKKALQALKQAVEKGFKNAALLRDSSEFAPFKEDKDFQQILEGLERPAPP